MTDSKKKAKGKSGTKAKKLQLNKETLKDLSAGGPQQVKGGVPRNPNYSQEDGSCYCPVTQFWSCGGAESCKC